MYPDIYSYSRTIKNAQNRIIPIALIPAISLLIPISSEALATNNNVYPTSSCKHVSLSDAKTKKSIIGAEDLAIDHQNGRLFISAYDRRIVEKTARKKRAEKIPEGGIYRLNIDRLKKNLDANNLSITLKSLVRTEDIDGGLRPHGISYQAKTQELAFINRGYFRSTNDKWKMKPQLERIGADGAVFMPKEKTTSCAANDILLQDEKTLVSFDHQHCNWRGQIEDLFSLRKSGLTLHNNKEPLFKKAGFANGITFTPSGNIALAATREKSIHLFTISEQHTTNEILRLGSHQKISLKKFGGPDNLTLAGDGAIIAAVHPSLIKMGMHRKLGWGHSPSKIIRIDIDTGKISTLYHDKSGKQFSAATVGVQFEDLLIIGSVTQAGLLVCQQ